MPKEISVIGQIEDNGPSAPGKRAVHWSRKMGGVSGDWTALELYVNWGVVWVEDIVLSIDVRAIHHDLGGSGSSPEEWEFPVTLRIDFRDVDGVARYWQFGWYTWIDAQTGPAPYRTVVDQGHGIVYSQRVPADQWIPMSFNLIGELATLAVPREITRIRVGGSGWNFEGRADNLRLDRVIPVESRSWGSIKAMYR